MKLKPFLQIASLLVAIVALAGAGCAAFNGSQQQRKATSLMDYLYPGDTRRTEQSGVAVLALPLRIGVAFVPESDKGQHIWRSTNPALDEARRQGLMRNVADHFMSLPMVSHIEIIPSAYLTPQGGFANVEQLKQMFDVEVIALLSYDQVQFTDESAWSFAYWTIVGAYVIEGERNDTRTLLDCALYDIPSRRLLFRAPGVSTVKGTSTPVNQAEQLRRDGEKGFDIAATNLVASLDAELPRFKARVKEKPEDIKVLAKPGFNLGSASFDGVSALALVALAWAAFSLKKPSAV